MKRVAEARSLGRPVAVLCILGLDLRISRLGTWAMAREPASRGSYLDTRQREASLQAEVSQNVWRPSNGFLLFFLWFPLELGSRVAPQPRRNRFRRPPASRSLGPGAHGQVGPLEALDPVFVR